MVFARLRPFDRAIIGQLGKSAVNDIIRLKNNALP